jgi:hypothetical protein
MEKQTTITRRRMLERGAVLGAGAVALAGVTFETAPPAGASESEIGLIVGSWKTSLVAQFPFGPQSSRELLMFSPGGGLIETITNPVGAGVGAWKKTSESTFRVAFQRFRFDDTGTFVGELQNLGTYVIDETGDSFTMQGEGELTDTSGVVLVRFRISSTGHRLPIPAHLL